LRYAIAALEGGRRKLENPVKGELWLGRGKERGTPKKRKKKKTREKRKKTEKRKKKKTQEKKKKKKKIVHSGTGISCVQKTGSPPLTVRQNNNERLRESNHSLNYVFNISGRKARRYIDKRQYRETMWKEASCTVRFGGNDVPRT